MHRISVGLEDKLLNDPTYVQEEPRNLGGKVEKIMYREEGSEIMEKPDLGAMSIGDEDIPKRPSVGELKLNF